MTGKEFLEQIDRIVFDEFDVDDGDIVAVAHDLPIR
jgi:hypothetical protein